MSLVIRRMMKFGLPIGGLELLLAGGAAYFAWEHEKGEHQQAHVLCPICWLNRVAPDNEPREGTGADS